MIRAIRRRTRLRLTLLYAVAFALVATAAMGSFWFAFVHAEFGAVDDGLRADAVGLVAGIQPAGTGATFGSHVPLPGESPQGVTVSALLVGPAGDVLDRALGGMPAADVSVLTRGALGGQTEIDTVDVAGISSRVLAEPLDVGGGRRGALVLARSVVELKQTLTRHAELLAAIDLALVVFASALGYWLAGRALQPVRTIAGMAREMSESHLDRRIELDLAPHDDLGELVATFNAMLARLDGAFTSLRRFTADAAHDLRAPLALLRSEVEVTLSKRRTPEEYEASLHTVLGETERLTRLADQLLLLARADAGALRARAEHIDVADLIDETAARWRTLAAGSGVQVETVVPDAGDLVGDRDLLGRLLDNLIDNAVRHTPEGGRIDVTAARADGLWMIDVRDTGEGIPQALRATLFERFSRGDPARGRDTGGAGLGLAVCVVIAGLHGGSIAAVEDDRGGHLRVELPAPADAGTAPD